MHPDEYMVRRWTMVYAFWMGWCGVMLFTFGDPIVGCFGLFHFGYAIDKLRPGIFGRALRSLAAGVGS